MPTMVMVSSLRFGGGKVLTPDIDAFGSVFGPYPQIVS